MHGLDKYNLVWRHENPKKALAYKWKTKLPFEIANACFNYRIKLGSFTIQATLREVLYSGSTMFSHL